MKKGEWSAEQKAVLQEREVKDSILNEILARTVDKMERNPYCRHILENAGYYETERPDGFDLHGFHLEKIYIGHSNEVSSPNGHCTKETFGYMNKRDEAERGTSWVSATRDAIFLNENVLKKQVVDVLQGMGEIGERLLRENGVSITENETFIDRGKNASARYDLIKDALADELSKNGQFREQFFSITTDILLCDVAHECAHAGQMQKKEWGAQMSRSLFRKEDIDREADFYCGRHDYARDEKGNLVFEKDTPYTAWLADLEKKRKTGSLYGCDNVAEAGVMAPAYVAFMEMNPSPLAIKVANELYDSRLRSVSMKNIMASFEKTHGVYESGNPAHQEALARSLVTPLLKDMEKKRSNVTFSYSDECVFDEIQASYRPEYWGSAKDYATAIPGQLTSEQISQLERMEYLWKVTNKLHHNRHIEQNRRFELPNISMFGQDKSPAL